MAQSNAMDKSKLTTAKDRAINERKEKETTETNNNEQSAASSEK